VLIGYFDEVAQTREIIEQRFDDLEGSRVKPIDGEEAYRRLMNRNNRRSSILGAE
jgi:hypothetical protein